MELTWSQTILMAPVNRNGEHQSNGSQTPLRRIAWVDRRLGVMPVTDKTNHTRVIIKKKLMVRPSPIVGSKWGPKLARKLLIHRPAGLVLEAVPAKNLSPNSVSELMSEPKKGSEFGSFISPVARTAASKLQNRPPS
jgi:hypothetical protein